MPDLEIDAAVMNGAVIREAEFALRVEPERQERITGALAGRRARRGNRPTRNAPACSGRAALCPSASAGRLAARARTRQRARAAITAAPGSCGRRVAFRSCEIRRAQADPLGRPASKVCRCRFPRDGYCPSRQPADCETADRPARAAAARRRQAPAPCSWRCRVHRAGRAALRRCAALGWSARGTVLRRDRTATDDAGNKE